MIRSLRLWASVVAAASLMTISMPASSEFRIDHFQVRREAHADHASGHPAGIPFLHVLVFALLEGLYSAVCSARDSNLAPVGLLRVRSHHGAHSF